jgi:predicted Fe-Mo cluster-binding NifX family protein
MRIILKKRGLKIGVAAEDKKRLEAEISMHFGRCPYYVILETDEGDGFSITGLYQWESSGRTKEPN